MMRACLLIIGSVVLLAACSSAQQKAGFESEKRDIDSFETARHQQVFKIYDGQDLEISNFFGDLQVRKGEAGAVEIDLFIQRKKASTVEGRISEKKIKDGLQLQVRASDKESENQLLRIDAVVLVPANSSLRLITDEGEIDARKLHNPLLEAISQSGDLALSSTSEMRARTEFGNIRASIMQPGWNGQHKLVSESGQIQATFPLGPNLNLNAKAGKSITSEFSLDIRQYGDHFGAKFSSGDASDAIVIKSRQGQIELFSSVFDPRVYGPPSIVTPQSTNQVD